MIIMKKKKKKNEFEKDSKKAYEVDVIFLEKKNWRIMEYYFGTNWEIKICSKKCV